jgi:hypothetical protein
VATSAEATRAVAWKTIPSWYLVATDDRTIGTDSLCFMAERAGSTTVEVEPRTRCRRPTRTTSPT